MNITYVKNGLKGTPITLSLEKAKEKLKLSQDMMIFLNTLGIYNNYYNSAPFAVIFYPESGDSNPDIKISFKIDERNSYLVIFNMDGDYLQLVKVVKRKLENLFEGEIFEALNMVQKHWHQTFSEVLNEFQNQID